MNLTIAAGQTLNLDGDPPPEWTHSFFDAPIHTFEDMFKLGLVSSMSDLETLLAAAKLSTDIALQTIGTRQHTGDFAYGRFTNLGRFPSYLANTAAVPYPQASFFWSVARRLNPTSLSRSDVMTSIVKEGITGISAAFGVKYYQFNDVTLEHQATLNISQEISLLWCDNLLIKQEAKIASSNMWIRALSIEGRQ
jgi:hypothetical protein